MGFSFPKWSLAQSSSNFHQKFPKIPKIFIIHRLNCLRLYHLSIYWYYNGKKYVNAIWQILSDSHRFELESRLRVILGDVWKIFCSHLVHGWLWLIFDLILPYFSHIKDSCHRDSVFLPLRNKIQYKEIISEKGYIRVSRK